MIQIGNSVFKWGSRTYIMGILNMTQDSFSGDGFLKNTKAAVKHALQMEKDGADIIDVGGESTRPAGTIYGKGAKSITVKEELERVLPVISKLASVLKIPISIDTYKAEIAERAIKEGALLINDVWGLKKDARIANVAAKTGAPLILTHNQEGFVYSDIIEDVILGLKKSKEKAINAGVLPKNIIIDPGIGFGKTLEHNLKVLSCLKKIRTHLKLPLLLGTSRKSFIGEILGGLPVHERLEGTAATVALGIAQGADMVRVHDVKEMVRVARVSDAILRNTTA